MRAFLVCLVVTLLAVSTGTPAGLNQHTSVPGGLPEIVQRVPERGGDTVRMWKRVQIKVIPLEVVAADNAELEALRGRVMQMEFDAAKLGTTNPAVREQLSRQLRLTRTLFHFIERQQLRPGRSRTVLDVESNLNHLQGQMMCEACHSRAIASAGPSLRTE